MNISYEPPEAGPHAALASAVRRRLLTLLRAGSGPQDAHQLAEAVGLHVTTVRFHLDVLARAGLVTGRPQRRGTGGRPRTVYSAASRSETTIDPGAGYQALAGLLAEHFDDAADRRAARAEQAGVAWAGGIDTLTGEGGTTAAEAARQVTGLFAELGFEPELVAAGDGTEYEPAEGAARAKAAQAESWHVRLRACPFRAVAAAHPEVVCNVHLGLLRGALTRLGAPPTTVGLRPFVTPELCIASLSPAD